MQMKNVLDRLTELAKDNPSPDVKQAMENTRRMSVVEDADVVEVHEGVAEGWKQTLRKFDPTIKARIRDKSQDQTNQGLDTIQHLADLDLTSDDMVSRAMKPNTYFKNAERYAKLANKGVTEDHGPEHPEAPENYGEYDREGDMAKDDLRTIDDAAEELYSILQADENLPEWVQSKITKAVDYIDTARDYMKAQKYEPGVAEGMFTKGPAIDPTVGKQINSIINRLHYHAKQTKDEYLRGTVQELFDILRNTGGTYSPPGSRDVAEGGAKYKVKSIGHDAKGNYYISPSTGKKVYKKAKVGDHENPKTGEHKGVTEAIESSIDEEKFNITFKAKTPAGKSFEKKYDIDAADKYAAFDKIKKRLGAQYDALNYPTFLQGKKKAKMPPSVKTAMKNLNKGKVS